MHQIEMVTLDSLVAANHIYRQLADIWSFNFPEKTLRSCKKGNPYKGYGKYE